MSVMEKHFQIELNEDRQAFLRSMGQNVMLNGKEVESAIELPDVAKISIESSEFIFIKQIARPKKRTSPVEEATIFINGQCDPEDIYEKFINLPIGRGVFARTDLGRGRFLVQYDGKLLLAEDVANPETNYTYFFSHQGKKYCIDATHEPEYGPSLGRLVNHADTNSERNAKMKVVVVNDLPCLALFSTRLGTF